MNPNYERIYQIGFLDDLHNYFPDILYGSSRFTSVQDLIRYIQDRTIDMFNIYDRSLSHYAEVRRTGSTAPTTRSVSQPSLRSSIPNAPTRPRNRPTIITETFDIPFHRPSQPILSPWTSFETTTNNLSNRFLLNILETMITDETQLAEGQLSPVVVRPSTEQIEDATTQRSATTDDEGNDTVCSICQDTYTSGQAIRTITHCNHYFHKNCIDPWFEQNAHCPVCRFDIRDTTSEATRTRNS